MVRAARFVKSPERALAALAQLHADGRTDVELTIVGDGPLRERLERQSVELGIEGSVEFHGHLDRPADVLQTCAVGLVTSDVEGFPNVILEMLAAGVGSVVTTECGGIGGLPGVVVTEDPGVETLAEALRAGRRPREDAEVAELLRPARRVPSSNASRRACERGAPRSRGCCAWPPSPLRSRSSLGRRASGSTSSTSPTMSASSSRPRTRPGGFATVDELVGLLTGEYLCA